MRARNALHGIESLAQALAGASPSPRAAIAVFRVPDFAKEAWRRGKSVARRMEARTARTFAGACAQLLRAGDLIAHEPGSDVFVAALLAPAREAGRPRSASDCRAAVERIALAMSLEIELRVETGWSPLGEVCSRSDLETQIERALLRGARERERYEFFSAVGHELRTPLTSINGYLETLLQNDLDSHTSRRFLETARAEALRLGRLIDGMFEFSLLDLSAASFSSGCTCVHESLQRAQHVVRQAARARGMTIEAVCPADAYVTLGEDALLQLLINLLDNAVKHGSREGCVGVHVAVRGDEVTICVDDDGPGVQEQQREAIFGLRVRGSSQGQGTGIGLAIVKMIAERAGGSVICTASPLGGARFEVSLPCGAELAVVTS